MSKREEDFIEAGIEYRFKHGTPNAIGGGALAEMVREMNRAKPFEAGAEYGYQYAIDKACKWLRAHLGAPAGIPQAKSYNDAMNELTTEFRKGMCNG
jgi:hypothetical protein